MTPLDSTHQGRHAQQSPDLHPAVGGYQTWPASDASGLRRRRHADASRRSILGVTIWTTLGAILPGVGLLAANKRFLGALLTAMTVAAPIAAVALISSGDVREMIMVMAMSPDALVFVAVLIGLAAALWATVIVATYRSLRDPHAPTAHRIVGTILTTALVAGMMLPAAAAVRGVLLQRTLVTSLFASGNDTNSPELARGGDPWRNVPQINVMLLGSDAGDDRSGIRPDTIMVANIDTKTGHTVLFSLPRSLQGARFPVGSPMHTAWPNGFRYARDPLINAVWYWAEDNDKLFPGDPNPGLTATRSAVEGTLGLKIDYWAMVNLQGFEDVINAIGGVRINVDQKIAIAGSHEKPKEWIMPGKQTLNGHDALWYGRSRWGQDDYSRMKRQRCLIGAVSKQADPLKLARAFPQLAASAKKNVQTSIPMKDVDAFVMLARRVQGNQITSLAFTNEIINTVNPDVPGMQRMVADSIARRPTLGTPNPTTTAPSPTATPKPSTTTTKPGGTTAPPTTAAAESLSDVCTF